MIPTGRLSYYSTLALTLFSAALVGVEGSPPTSDWVVEAGAKGAYTSVTKALTYTNADGESMPYRLYTPENYDPNKKYPVILSLHGAGSRAEDNKKHLRDWVAAWTGSSVQDKYPSFIVMPQTSKDKSMGTWSGTTWKTVTYDLDQVPESKSMRLAKEILDKVIADHSIDTNRVYIMGASMGGCGTWNFCMRYPDIVAAAIPVCGNSDVTKGAILKDIPIWTFHGDQDTGVPFEASVKMVDAIKAAGGTKVKFTIYPGVGHGSFKLFWKEGALVDWLFAQSLEGRKAKN